VYEAAIPPAAMLLFFNCLLYCYWSQLEIAIAIVDCAADFFNATRRLFVLSVFYFFITSVALGWAGVTAVFIYSMSDFSFSSDHPFHGHFLGEPTISAAQTALWVVLFFCFNWISTLIVDKMAFITMYSCASYYFSSEGGTDGSADVT